MDDCPQAVTNNAKQLLPSGYTTIVIGHVGPKLLELGLNSHQTRLDHWNDSSDFQHWMTSTDEVDESQVSNILPSLEHLSSTILCTIALTTTRTRHRPDGPQRIAIERHFGNASARGAAQPSPRYKPSPVAGGCPRRGHRWPVYGGGLQHGAWRQVQDRKKSWR